MLAGEVSGDHHAAAFVAALKEHVPGARFVGMGGEHLKAEGVALVAELDTLAVMGFSEVVSRIPYFWRLERSVVRMIEAERPDLVVLVDYPGFNLRIARAAHARGCKVLYYIAPKVWAWKRGRARTLAATTDGVATILPFEAELLREYGADAHYVGNPLLDRRDDVPGRDECFRAWGLDPERPLLGVLPGSRSQELDEHLGPFLEIARAVVEGRPDVQVAFSRAETMDMARFEAVEFPVVTETRALQRWSDAALVKSGTSTLETALERTPFVIAYRTSPLTSWLVRRVLRIEHIGLPNLIADRRIVPEVLQNEVTPSVVAPLLLELLDADGHARAEQLADLDRVIERLGSPGASRRVAEMAMTSMGAGS